MSDTYESPDSLDHIATALDRLATIAEKWFARIYPERRDVRPATLTTVQSDEERERTESLQGLAGNPVQPIEQWKDIGRREQAFIDAEEAKKAPPKTGRS